jgi:hypothetical protein
MEKEKLYAVAIFALKPDPEQTVIQKPDGRIITSNSTRAGSAGGTYETTPGVGVTALLAASLELAVEAGLREAHAMFPESEGWQLHFANAVEIDHSAILDAANSITKDYQPKPDEPEREM